MSPALGILSVGAVTSVGLDAFQTAAAFRARIAGFRREIALPPPEEPLHAAKIPVRGSLRTNERVWLVNMAARVVRECLRYRSFPPRLALILAVPEAERAHPGMEDANAGELVAEIAGSVTETNFALALSAGAGAAGIATGLAMAKDLMLRGAVDACLVGGVDSLVNGVDRDRLREAGRILEPGNPKGLIPGEGAGTLLVVPTNNSSRCIAQLYGVNFEMEQDSVIGPRLSQGRGFVKALKGAIADSGMPESSISFRVSTVNGEHYTVWESMFYSTRAYRATRASFPVWYTASSVGDMGAASGVVSVILAALGIAGGYAPGPYAMCESASETGLRGACLIGPALGAPLPPFHPDGGASSHVLQSFRHP